jgi:hypothetical protein
MSPFEKLIQGGYSSTITRDSSLPKLGGQCAVKRVRDKRAGRREGGAGETITRDSSGPPGRGRGSSREGPA